MSHYSTWRNGFIPKAKSFADGKYGKDCHKLDDIKIKEQWYADWNKTFHNKMDELVAKTNRRKGDNRRGRDTRE